MSRRRPGETYRFGVGLIVVLLLVSSLGAGVVVAADDTANASSSANTTENTTAEPLDIDTKRVNIYLRSSRTVVGPEEYAVFQYSATNYVTNSEPLTVQLILEAPSGVAVSGARNVDAGSSQFTRTVHLDPGETAGTTIFIRPNSPGEYAVTGEAVYYFGDDKAGGQGRAIDLSITQQPPPPTVSERIERVVTGLGRGLLSSAPWILAAGVAVIGGLFASRYYTRLGEQYRDPNRVVWLRTRQLYLKLKYAWVICWGKYLYTAVSVKQRLQRAPEGLFGLLFPLPYGWLSTALSAYLLGVILSPVLGPQNAGELFLVLWIVGLIAPVAALLLDVFHHYVLWYLVFTFGGLLVLLAALLGDVRLYWILDIPLPSLPVPN
ncbi:hypothetical protein [Halobellus sp. H-GB7]|uniref:hypothetical protein n=1 Tax=Halobellus sp. H-GB7 TaxID=3069756 RepID=UPI0027B72DAE|nr:hypothetical protein [Halobellus sp. H-GB7]MDQ2055512.1 hypothetical protein [Halobellus sp. H-GB7]